MATIQASACKAVLLAACLLGACLAAGEALAGTSTPAAQDSAAVSVLQLNQQATISHDQPDDVPLFTFTPLRTFDDLATLPDINREIRLEYDVNTQTGRFELVYLITSHDGQDTEITVPVDLSEIPSDAQKSPRIPAESSAKIFARSKVGAFRDVLIRAVTDTRFTQPPKIGGVQSAGAWPFWVSMSALQRLPSEKRVLVEEMYNGIVSLEMPLHCEKDKPKCIPFENCTAFRVGQRLFATSWHCLSQYEKKSCSTMVAKFRLARSGTELPLKPVPPVIEERCQSIKYLNPNLDFAVFEITERNASVWGNGKIFKFAMRPDQNSRALYPYAGQHLAVLHYPATNPACAAPPDDPRVGVAYGFRISVFGEPGGAQDCRVVGYDRKPKPCIHSQTGKPVQCIEWPSLLKFDAKHSNDTGTRWGTNKGISNSRPMVAFQHQCASCGGSSGAPVISLSDSETGIEGDVIGIHQGENLDRRTKPGYEFKLAIRTSAIADCIELPKLHAGVVELKFSEKKKHCFCRLPADCRADSSKWKQ